MLFVDMKNAKPVYRQLFDQVQAFIASQTLQPGDVLPSTRQLSLQLGINPMTISKAYALLEREGLVERRPGRPLAVRAVSKEHRQQTKMVQLEASLMEPVRIVKQLEIDHEDALEQFRTMMEDASYDHNQQ
jgi:GntR family transcriptional regulator